MVKRTCDSYNTVRYMMLKAFKAVVKVNDWCIWTSALQSFHITVYKALKTDPHFVWTSFYFASLVSCYCCYKNLDFALLQYSWRKQPGSLKPNMQSRLKPTHVMQTQSRRLTGENSTLRPTQAFSHLFSSCSCSASAPLHWFKSRVGMFSSSVEQQHALWK